MTNKLKEVKIPQVKIDKSTSRELMQQRNKEIAKALWTGKLTPAEQAAINQICLLYGLDPILKQVVCLGGNIYITGGGLKVIGNRNPESAINGIELTPATEEERKLARVPETSHYWKATIWKKGCEKPFIEFGEASEGNVKLYNADWKSYQDMAKTRAVNRALRNAYDIAFTSLEEVGYATEAVIDIVPTSNETTEEKNSAPNTKHSPTMLEIKIHGFKKELYKLTGNDETYYSICGDLGFTHVTEMDIKTQSVFATKLASKIKELQKQNNN